MKLFIIWKYTSTCCSAARNILFLNKSHSFLGLRFSFLSRASKHFKLSEFQFHLNMRRLSVSVSLSGKWECQPFSFSNIPQVHLHFIVFCTHSYYPIFIIYLLVIASCNCKKMENIMKVRFSQLLFGDDNMYVRESFSLFFQLHFPFECNESLDLD